MVDRRVLDRGKSGRHTSRPLRLVCHECDRRRRRGCTCVIRRGRRAWIASLQDGPMTVSPGIGQRTVIPQVAEVTCTKVGVGVVQANEPFVRREQPQMQCAFDQINLYTVLLRVTSPYARPPRRPARTSASTLRRASDPPPPRCNGSRPAKYSYVATGSSRSSYAVRIRERLTGSRRPLEIPWWNERNLRFQFA